MTSKAVKKKSTKKKTAKKKKAELSELHKRFCIEFIKDLSPTRAYLRTYPESSYDAAKSSASTLLSKSKIIARIAVLMSERSERVKVDIDNVLESLLEIRERCLQNTPVMEFCYDEKRMIETGEYEFKENGALKANELIGRHLAMFTDKTKVEHSLKEGLAERIAKAREALKGKDEKKEQGKNEKKV